MLQGETSPRWMARETERTGKGRKGGGDERGDPHPLAPNTFHTKLRRVYLRHNSIKTRSHQTAATAEGEVKGEEEGNVGVSFEERSRVPGVVLFPWQLNLGAACPSGPPTLGH